MSVYRISFFVLALHMAAILWFARVKEKINHPPVRLVTQTVTFAEEVQIAAVKHAEPQIVETPKPKTKPKPVPKKTEEKKKIIKDPAMVAKAKESIAKISKTSDKNNSRAPSRKEKGAQAAPAGKPSNFEAGYREELANRLKLLLSLPEYGVVEVKLTVNRKGLVQRVEIVASESDINKSYIEKALPELAFPPFGNNFAGDVEHTFIISLNNEL